VLREIAPPLARESARDRGGVLAAVDVDARGGEVGEPAGVVDVEVGDDDVADVSGSRPRARTWAIAGSA
jgi:hypothetical protein